MAPYPGALALNFRRSVPGKPPYSGAWPLNFRGCCPGSHPKSSLKIRAQKFCGGDSGAKQKWLHFPRAREIKQKFQSIDLKQKFTRIKRCQTKYIKKGTIKGGGRGGRLA